MYTYAQTNIQLFNQLQKEGYVNDDLKLIANAYYFMITLFTGHFRESGKTFIAHLVGTASILAHLQVSAQIVAAGLLHATYARGSFGQLEKRGVSEFKRKQVIEAVGENCEEYIAKYYTLKWKKYNIFDIYKNIDQLKKIDRDVILIRLANELEEHLDQAIAYCSLSRRCNYKNHDQTLVIKLAHDLGFPTLADELTQAFQASAMAEIPSELCHASGQRRSFLIAPHLA